MLLLKSTSPRLTALRAGSCSAFVSAALAFTAHPALGQPGTAAAPVTKTDGNTQTTGQAPVEADTAPSTSTGEGTPEYKPWPAKTVLLPLEATNVPSADVDAFTALFVQAYEEASGGRVMPPKETERALQALSTPAAVLSASGAKGYLSGSVVQLDSRIVISISVFDPQGNRVEQQKMTASGVDDFEPVSIRLANALAKSQSAKEVRTLDDVTEREGQPRQRVASERTAGLRGGVAVPISQSSVVPLVIAALDVRFESEQHAVGFSVGLLLPTGNVEGESAYGGLTSDVHALYYLTRESLSPYVSGGINVRIVGSNEAGGANVAPFAALGLALAREAKASAYLELRATQNVTPIRFRLEADPAVPGSLGSSRAEYPFEPSLNAGVAF